MTVPKQKAVDSASEWKPDQCFLLAPVRNSRRGRLLQQSGYKVDSARSEQEETIGRQHFHNGVRMEEGEENWENSKMATYKVSNLRGRSGSTNEENEKTGGIGWEEKGLRVSCEDCGVCYDRKISKIRTVQEAEVQNDQNSPRRALTSRQCT